MPAISRPLVALISEMESGVTARESRGRKPRSISTRLAFGESCKPAPVSSSRSLFSRTMTRNPCRASASEAVSPPMPAPATIIVRDAVTPPPDRSGHLVGQHAFRRPGFTGLEVGGVTIERRTIGADDLVVVAEIEKDVRVVEGWVGAHAHEFLRADLDDGDAGIVVKVGDDMIGHRIHLR